jgi:hypothetical protein
MQFVAERPPTAARSPALPMAKRPKEQTGKTASPRHRHGTENPYPEATPEHHFPYRGSDRRTPAAAA